ncbi:MAG: hypothetical protein UR12_C0018G0013 [candidate division TM6 bacterium GW2011_GWF2_30_66]|nr:MAG: hypothetical protein UR12_C0018G0013 [candidate division TM6 bacterium GW2011_GWF2_30_66]
MKKMFLKTQLFLCSLLFCTTNLFSVEYFTVLVKIKPMVIQTSFNKLTKKYIKIKDLRTNKLYLANLESLLNATYKRFYPSTWSYVKINQTTDSNFTIVKAGKIIKRGNKEYVRSLDGKIEVPLQIAIEAVEKAININTKYYKNKLGKNYKNKIWFNLKPDLELLYDPEDKNTKNTFIAQRISFEKLGENHRLYTLGTEVINELAKIGLKPKNNSLKPYISLAKLSAQDCKIINKLKDLEKDKNSGISKILNYACKTKNSQNFTNYFDKILISKSTLSNNTIIKTLGIK